MPRLEVGRWHGAAALAGQLGVSILRVALLSVALLAGALLGPARAEIEELRIGRQLGLGYLQLYVMQDQQLVEKHTRAAGLTVRTRYLPLGSPAVLNEQLLSGNIEL